MCEGEAAREEHLRQIAQAEFVAQPLQDDEQGNVGGHLQVIDGRARAFVKGAPAGAATEEPIPQRCRSLQLLCRIPQTVRAGHRPLLNAFYKGVGYPTAWALDHH